MFACWITSKLSKKLPNNIIKSKAHYSSLIASSLQRMTGQNNISFTGIIQGFDKVVCNKILKEKNFLIKVIMKPNHHKI